MKKIHNGCDLTLIDRFFDNELGPDEHARVSEHLTNCPSCQKRLRDNQTISSLLKAGVNKELSSNILDDLEEGVVDLIRKKSAPWWKKLLDLSVSKKILIPATAAAVIIALFLTLPKQPVPVSGPSALVKTLSGEFSSVMIIETPKLHQTIIWYSESF